MQEHTACHAAWQSVGARAMAASMAAHLSAGHPVQAPAALGDALDARWVRQGFHRRSVGSVTRRLKTVLRLASGANPKQFRDGSLKTFTGAT